MCHNRAIALISLGAHAQMDVHVHGELRASFELKRAIRMHVGASTFRRNHHLSFDKIYKKSYNVEYMQVLSLHFCSIKYKGPV